MMKRIVPSLVVLTLIFIAVSCNRSGQTAKDIKQDLKTFKVTATEVQSFVEATGSVQPDLTGSSRLASSLAGTVGQVFIKVGDRVKKGDPLLLIKSPEVTDTYSNYLSTLTQSKQSERIYNLNKQLFEVGAITRNDLLNSESTFKQIKAVSEGLKRKLKLFGCHAEEDTPEAQQTCSDTITVKAPMDGYVADIPIHVGDKVDTSTPLMTIADPQNIVVVANVYDSDVSAVKKGNNVTFFADIFPDQTFKGIITYVSDVSDTDSKTVKTFIKILDKNNLFKQNMFLKLKIEGEKRMLPIIPQTAMVYREGKFYVYVPIINSKEQACELKEIKPIREVPGKFMAIEGLRQGDEVVVSAINREKT